MPYKDSYRSKDAPVFVLYSIYSVMIKEDNPDSFEKVDAYG